MLHEEGESQMSLQERATTKSQGQWGQQMQRTGVPETILKRMGKRMGP